MAPAKRRYPFRKLVVFISSRVEQEFAGTRLETVRASLAEQLGSPAQTGDEDIWTQLLICCHAILGVTAARELVGQPFLHDHALADRLGKVAGPVHPVACHRGVTESRAVRQLGFPDATIVRERFGVYVADDVQKIQLIMLRDCRDPSSTLLRLDELCRWLAAFREGERLARRARARAAIARTPAEHVEVGA